MDPLIEELERVREAMTMLTDALIKVTAERDRYRDAMRAIGELPWCGTCAPGYNAIVSAALDGEG